MRIGFSAAQSFQQAIFAGRSPRVGSNQGRSEPVSRVALREMLEETTDMRRGLLELKKALRGSSAPTRSSTAVSSIVLNPVSATTVSSTEEVNATPTSYGPLDNTIKNSTSLPTLRGIYDGARGDTELTFKFDSNATVGVDAFTVQLKDGGTTLESISVAAGTPADSEIAFSNGLVLSLSAGTLKKNATLKIDVFSSVGTVVDPDKAMDGVRAGDPSLEYPMTVVDGSFDVNGVSIAVSASDSINQVLEKINQSVAGVTAAFDAASETVQLTNTELGPEALLLDNDSSGFLSAVKLAAAAPVLGRDESTDAMSLVPALAGVSAGTASIGGASFSVDPSVDSIADIADRINGLQSGVSASLVDGRFVLSSGAGYSLDSETSNLFAALGLADGFVGGSQGKGKPIRPRQATQALKRVAASLNAIFGADVGHTVHDTIKSRLAATIKSAFSTEGDVLKTGFGLRFDFSPDASKTLRLPSTLGSDLARHATKASRFFSRDLPQRDENLVDALLAELDGASHSLGTLLGNRGNLVSTVA